MPHLPPMQRVVVLGTSGSGKTTLTRDLSRVLGVPAVELDAIHWKPNWTPTPMHEMRPIIAELAVRPAWAVDGNYGAVRDLLLARADTIVWLDYSLTVTFCRVLRRTLGRWWRNEELWNGNRESLRLHFSRDSILLWVLTTWRRRRREYPKLLRAHRERGTRVLRFRTPRQTAAWLASLSPAA